MTQPASVKVDTAWFLELIRVSPYGSQRAFARRMKNSQGKPMDHSTLSRMLSGERTMQLADARQIADLLGVGLGEVLAHAGLRKDEPKAKRLQITGSVGSGCDVKIESASRTVDSPEGLPEGSIVLRGRGPFEGWVFFAARPIALAPRLSGRLCVVEMKDGRRILGYVLQVKRSSAAIESFRGSEMIQFSPVKWVSPVLWIRS